VVMPRFPSVPAAADLGQGRLVNAKLALARRGLFHRCGAMRALGLGLLLLSACAPTEPAIDEGKIPTGPSASGCFGVPLALQNARSHTLGDTFYLPQVIRKDGCPTDARWDVQTAPAGSRSRVFASGAPQPRFTPDVAGTYVLSLSGVPGSEQSLRVVARPPAERFANHYLTPLYGLTRVGDELWSANGAAYTVTRLKKDGTGYRKQDEIPVGSWPAAVIGSESLPHVLVAQRGADTVGFIDRSRGVLEDALWVGDEPTGLALSPDGKWLYVSLATMRQVAVVDVAAREVAARIDVGFDPRALALSADGKRLFVASYRSANLQDGPMGMRKPEDDQDIWIVDTVERKVTKTILSVAADLRALTLSDDGSELYVAASDGDTVPPQNEPTAKPFVHQAVVIAADPLAADYGQVRRRADLTRQDSAKGLPFVHPAGVLAVGDALWLSAEASGQVLIVDRATLAERRRTSVCQGPRKLVALPQGGVAVHCFQSFAVAILGADGALLSTVPLSDDPRPAAVALGEKIFTQPGAGFAANHSCSGCHVETQNDGMVWRFGPRIWHNVRPLQLLQATTPLEWGAYVSSAENFGFQGPPSIVGTQVNTVEAEGLAAFLGSLLGAPRATHETRLDGSYTDAGLAGKEIFEKKLSCAGCHTPPLYTNRAYVPRGKSGEAADVPSLLGVYRHGVYMVNGKPRSLAAAVDVALAYVGASVSADERSQLISFLAQLTPKGAAPLGIWPDIDSDQGVLPDVQPWAAFSEPVDDSDGDAATLAQVQGKLALSAVDGPKVPGTARIDGQRLRFVPNQPLSAGTRYRFCVEPGLRFRSGGVLDLARCSEFAVAQPAVAELPAAMTLSIQLPAMGGPPPPPIVFNMAQDANQPGSLRVQLSLGANQQQTLWARVDADTLRMQPFALPLPGRGVADAANVVGKVTMSSEVGGRKQASRIEGTLRLGAPGINIPGIAFVITPK